MTEQVANRDQHDDVPLALRTAHIKRSTNESTVEVELNLEALADRPAYPGHWRCGRRCPPHG